MQTQLKNEKGARFACARRSDEPIVVTNRSARMSLLASMRIPHPRLARGVPPNREAAKECSPRSKMWVHGLRELASPEGRKTRRTKPTRNHTIRGNQSGPTFLAPQTTAQT